MNKKHETGVYQLGNGNWAYRFVAIINGKTVTQKRTTDEFGNKFKTQKSAVKAREKALIAARTERLPSTGVIPRRTISEIYNEYCDKGRLGKAYTTILKQDSLWKNHLKERFGSRFIDDVTQAEIIDYLSELYYIKGLSFRYVESFLKMFYLIYGQAYNRNYLSSELYTRMCKNKETKITMPKMKSDEDTDIVCFSQEEIELLDKYFNGGYAETAYLLGKYCGLRINECFGIKWENVDLESGSILIDRQMQYQEGLIKLVPLKTHNSKRTVYMCDQLKEYLTSLSARNAEDAERFAALRRQNETFIEDIDGNMISSTTLVNSLYDGTIRTVNSMKYHSKSIKERLGINFKYHYLRHTYGTRLAEMNTPTHLLCNQMGHASGKVTEKYYIAISQRGIDILTNNLNNL